MYNCDMGKVCRICDHNRHVDYGIRSGNECDLITKISKTDNICYLPLVVELQKQILEKDNALEESVKLQSHYAEILNMHDGGKRIQFSSAKEWIDRLEYLQKGREKKSDKENSNA